MIGVTIALASLWSLLGALIGGAIAQAFGLYPDLVVRALGGSFSFLWVLYSPVRHVKGIPTAAEVEK